jgi:hypothetical protein
MARWFPAGAIANSELTSARRCPAKHAASTSTRLLGVSVASATRFVATSKRVSLTSTLELDGLSVGRPCDGATAGEAASRSTEGRADQRGHALISLVAWHRLEGDLARASVRRAGHRSEQQRRGESPRGNDAYGM